MRCWEKANRSLVLDEDGRLEWTASIDARLLLDI